MVKDLLYVAIGGAIGSILRYLVSIMVKCSSTGFPWATFIVNILGCLLIGLLYGLTTRFPNTSQHLMLFLTVGLCGGFTTFSTFSLEAFNLFDNKQYAAGSIYVILSCGCCIIGILCGKKIASVIKL